MEFHEEQTVKGILSFRKFYAKSGTLVSSLQKAKQKNTYVSQKYFASGTIKEGGQVIYIPTLLDYKKHGDWKRYSSSGNVIAIEKYINGQHHSTRTLAQKIEPNNNKMRGATNWRRSKFTP